MPTYTPRAGDLVRDASDDLWFVYADDRRPANLYGINASHRHGQAGQPVRDVETNWGPLRLEHRPT